jgi:hypothetical protein
MKQTVMAEAFRDAGYQTADERLDAIAREAWAKWSSHDAGGARRDYVMARLRADLTWALIERWQPAMLTQAVGWLLNRARDEIAAEQPQRNAGKPAGGGRVQSETHPMVAPANPSGATPDGDRGRGGSETQSILASVAPSDAGATRRSEPAGVSLEPARKVPAAPTYDRHAATVAAKAEVARRLSRLDTVTIDGKPIGDCIASEVRAWAETRQRDARSAGRDASFARSLAANLPGNAVIREWWTKPGEVDELYERAEADYAAAA